MGSTCRGKSNLCSISRGWRTAWAAAMGRVMQKMGSTSRGMSNTSRGMGNIWGGSEHHVEAGAACVGANITCMETSMPCVETIIIRVANKTYRKVWIPFHSHSTPKEFQKGLKTGHLRNMPHKW